MPKTFFWIIAFTFSFIIFSCGELKDKGSTDQDPFPTLNPPVLGISASDSNSIQLKWAAIKEASSYLLSVYQLTPDTLYIGEFKDYEINQPSFLIDGLKPQNNYYVRIKSKTGERVSDYSKEVLIKTWGKISMKYPHMNGKWLGKSVAYDPSRGADGGLTTEEHILEDLNLISQHWNMIRLYGSDNNIKKVVKVLHDHKIPLKVMLGVWLQPENTTEKKEINQNQVIAAIDIVSLYPEEIIALNAGNEVFFEHSPHRITDKNIVYNYIDQLRRNTSLPVTVADFFTVWQSKEAIEIAKKLDFIVMHVYNWQSPDEDISYIDNNYKKIKNNLGDKLIVIGETGWPSHDKSKESAIHTESNQKDFYLKFSNWAEKNEVISFYFKAFDVDWNRNTFDDFFGLYSKERVPKAALQ